MKKYILPVAAFLLIGTAAGAQTEKKQQPMKPMTTKPATTNAARSARPKPAMVDSTAKHSSTTAIRRKTHTKPAGTAPAKTGSK